MTNHDPRLGTPIEAPEGFLREYKAERDALRDTLTPPAPAVEPLKIVKVFVRLGDSDGERTIAFRIPDSIDSMDLLDRGATIDGNQAILPLAWDDDVDGAGNGAYTCPDLNIINNGTIYEDFTGKSMARVLGDCQRGLVRFFKEHGFRVQFA